MVWQPLHADNGQKGEQSTMFAIGTAKVFDTYLSAEQYTGAELRFIGQRRKPLRNHLLRVVTQDVALVGASNRADNRDEMGGHYQLQYSLRRFWQTDDKWCFEAGAAAMARLGFLYNTSNTNNPAQAYADVQLAPTAAVSYDLPLWHRHFLLRYELAVPLFGVMFSPNYGQSYYEIFTRGNYDHNIVPTTIASAPSLCHSLTVSIPLSKREKASVLRIGFMGDYRQAKVNNLKQHHYSHLFMIGYAKTL